MSRPLSSQFGRTDFLNVALGDVDLRPAGGVVRKSPGGPSSYPAVVEEVSRVGQQEVVVRGEEQDQARGVVVSLKRKLFSESAGPKMFD